MARPLLSPWDFSKNMTDHVNPKTQLPDEFLHDAEFLSRSGTWVYTPGTQAEIWSDGLRYLLGIEGESPALFDFFPELQPRMATFLKGRIPYIRHKWTAKDRDGDPIMLLLQAAKRKKRGENGENHDYLIGVIQDISEIEPPPAPSGLGDQLLTNILSFGELFALIIDMNERIMYIDGQGADRAGFSSETIGKSITDVFPEDSAVVRQIRAAIQNESGSALYQSGGAFIEYRFNPLYDQMGESCGVIGFAIDVTPKIQAMRSVEESERKYRTIFDNSRDAIAVLDRTGRMIFCNPKALQMIELEPNEVIGHRIIEFSPLKQPDGRISAESFEKALDQTIQGIPQQIEWAYRRPDGSLAHADLNLSPVEIDGETYVIHLAHDRTEQIVAKRNEIMLADVFRSIQDGILLIDRGLKIVRTNEAMQKLYPGCDFTYGRKCLDIVQHADKVNSNAPPLIVPKSGQAETVIRFEAANDYHSGRWIEHVTLPIIDQRKGKITLFFNSIRDITERINTEKELDRYRKDLEKMVQERAEQLALSEAMLRGVLEGSSSAIHFYDTELRTTYTNPAFQALVGYTAEEMMEMPLSRILCQGFPESEEVFARTRRVLSGSLERYRLECPIRRRNNEIVWVDINVSSVCDAHGKIQQIVAVMADVTDRRRMLRELKDAITSAEGAKEAADAANTSKSQFLAHMSHEIRTPLNGVIGLCDLLLQTDLGPKQLEYAQLIRASGKSLFYLINDILDFSKIEAGKLDIDNSLFDVYELVESVLGILATRAEDKGIELCVSFDPQVPHTIFADSGRIRQIMINLIGNAIKFTDEGGVRVHVFLDQEIFLAEETPDVPRDEHGKPLPYRSTLRFLVADSGIGIPKDRMDRLFQSFSQVDSSTARKYGGTGLGLAISIRLVHLMGGDMGVESEEGKGATFWFTVPVYHQPSLLALSDPNFDRNVSEANLALLSRRPVLIVDDNTIQRQTLLTQLELWQMKPVACQTLPGAIEKLESAISTDRPFELAIIDQTITNARGTDLIEAIHQIPKLEGLPQILLLPLTTEVELSLMPLPGTVRKLSKPVFNSTLFAAIFASLFGTEQGDAASAARENEEKDSDLIPRETTQMRRRSGIRVLVAEDNRVNQIVVTDTLKTAGYDSALVDNGRLALEAVTSEHFDMVLMDCQMPEMDGYEATRKIRQWESETTPKNRIPIIALTANVTKEDEQLCLAAGMDAYCSKPINPKTLIATLDQWLPENLGEYTHHSRETIPVFSNEPIVVSRIEEHCGGNATIVQGVLGEFLHQVPLDLEEIERRLEDRNYSRVWTVIHSMMGTAGVVGASRLHDICDEIERYCQSCDQEALSTKLPLLRNEVNRCCDFIRHYCAAYKK